MAKNSGRHPPKSSGKAITARRNTLRNAAVGVAVLSSGLTSADLARALTDPQNLRAFADNPAQFARSYGLTLDPEFAAQVKKGLVETNVAKTLTAGVVANAIGSGQSVKPRAFATAGGVNPRAYANAGGVKPRAYAIASGVQPKPQTK
jgi:hypothetical protein